MQSYRLSTNLKLGLVLFAVLIAVASLAYTSRLVGQLRVRESAVVQLWAEALKEITNTQRESINPYQPEFLALSRYIEAARLGIDEEAPSPEQWTRFMEAVQWAQSMPPIGETSFIANFLLIRDDGTFTIPSILSDSTGPVTWRHLPIDTELANREDSLEAMELLAAYQEEMDELNAPIVIEVSSPPFGELRNWIHYGESQLIRELRIFPYVQLLFVSLFILVGYLGFSYVRRNEQSSLWVGMAKEAAHQLGTPISSLMGWTQLLQTNDLSREQSGQALEEIDKDIGRLQRVANRFSNIGSRPQLESTPIEPVISSMIDYMRLRMPQGAKKVELEATIDPELEAPLNTELFEWVIENLLKNALDAIEKEYGHISIKAYPHKDLIYIDVQDNGKGIDRRQWKNIFRPGYSTKKRGWGLGLSLAKRIIEDYHGGSLQLIQSKVNEGSSFRISLPRQQESSYA